MPLQECMQGLQHSNTGDDIKKKAVSRTAGERRGESEEVQDFKMDPIARPGDKEKKERRGYGFGRAESLCLAKLAHGTR